MVTHSQYLVLLSGSNVCGWTWHSSLRHLPSMGQPRCFSPRSVNQSIKRIDAIAEGPKTATEVPAWPLPYLRLKPPPLGPGILDSCGKLVGRWH